jgi:hypothetical protein
LIPSAVVLATNTGFYIHIKRRYSVTKIEAIQAIFVLFFTAFLILTVTGIWFRGTGMRLIWPI